MSKVNDYRGAMDAQRPSCLLYTSDAADEL